MRPVTDVLCFVFLSCQFHNQSKLYKETLHNMNTIFTSFFTIECLLKIAAFGVRVRKKSTVLNLERQLVMGLSLCHKENKESLICFLCITS